MKTKEAKDGGDVPLLGRPGYEEYTEKQGQQAMDQALAMPLVRVFFGALSICVGLLCFFLIADLPGLIVQRQWRSVLENVGFTVLWLPLLLDMGSVCLFGRSRTPWYRAIMRSYKAKA